VVAVPANFTVVQNRFAKKLFS